jgi:hypothetical protein
MRKIDKSNILSTKYKQWEESIRDRNHPEYNSSNNKFYTDIVMNLLHIQEGLCAYTEMRLCAKELIENSNWEDGRYKFDNPEFKGQLDHFDPSLKKEKAWLWSNLFVIDTDINTKVKGKQDIDDILKPDTESYNEDELLEYDCNMHIFVANSSLGEEEQQRINKMILKLGINFDPVIDQRKEYLNDKFAMKRFGLEVEVNQFPTAYKMCKNIL